MDLKSAIHFEAKIGQQLDVDERNTLASLYFGRGRIPSDGELEKRLELMAETHVYVKGVDVSELKKDINIYCE